MGGFAWVTLATNDSYSLGALVLAHSLRNANTAHKLAVLITPGVSPPMKEQLSTVFDVVKVVDVLDSKDEAHLALMKRPELGVTFTKIHCWRLTEFEKCVFLDADTLVLKNCDELFDREELSAAPDVGWPDCFNTGVFVFKPSIETFDNLIKFSLDNGSFDGGDQGLLNQFFGDWATKDINKHLPFVYNLTSVAVYSYIPAFKQYETQVRIVHFIGSEKPWLQQLDPQTGSINTRPGSEHLTPMLQLWWNIFCDKVHPSMTTNLECDSGMRNDEVEACVNDTSVEHEPENIQPFTPYVDKDDSRQINLPYQPFDVRSSSGELLNLTYLEKREQEMKEEDKEEKDEKKQDEEKEKDVKEEWKPDEGAQQPEPVEKEEEVACNERENQPHEHPVVEEQQPPREEPPEEQPTAVDPSPFNYETFFPDENCVQTYLQQNVMTYQPLEKHEKKQDVDPVPEREHQLPRFLTIAEDDKRQSQNMPFHEDSKPSPTPHEEENHHPSETPNETITNDASEENRQVPKTSPEPVSPLRESVSSLGSAPPTNPPDTVSFWKSHPSLNDTNRKFSMPKLKPILPRHTIPQIMVSDIRPKITQYTEFHMSCEYPDAVPCDTLGFVERHILEEVIQKVPNAETEKLKTLSYIFPLEAAGKTETTKEPPEANVVPEETDYDLSSCQRQRGNQPLQSVTNKRANSCFLPVLKPIRPTKNEEVKRKFRPHKKSPKERGTKAKIESRKAREKAKAELSFKPIGNPATSVEEILTKLINFSKDYQGYFTEDPTGKEKDKDQNKEKEKENLLGVVFKNVYAASTKDSPRIHYSKEFEEPSDAPLSPLVNGYSNSRKDEEGKIVLKDTETMNGHVEEPMQKTTTSSPCTIPNTSNGETEQKLTNTVNGYVEESMQKTTTTSLGTIPKTTISEIEQKVTNTVNGHVEESMQKTTTIPLGTIPKTTIGETEQKLTNTVNGHVEEPMQKTTITSLSTSPKTSNGESEQNGTIAVTLCDDFSAVQADHLGKNETIDGLERPPSGYKPNREISRTDIPELKKSVTVETNGMDIPETHRNGTRSPGEPGPTYASVVKNGGKAFRTDPDTSNATQPKKKMRKSRPSRAGRKEKKELPLTNQKALTPPPPPAAAPPAAAKEPETVTKPTNPFSVLPEDSPGEVTLKQAKRKSKSVPPLPSRRPPPRKTNQDRRVVESLATVDDALVDNSGIAGAIAKLSIQPGGLPGTTGEIATSAQEDYVRRQNWEMGTMDYMGRDSFDNIWSKICETIDGKVTKDLNQGGESSTPSAEATSSQEDKAAPREKSQGQPEESPKTMIAQSDVVPPVESDGTGKITSEITTKATEIASKATEALEAFGKLFVSGPVAIKSEVAEDAAKASEASEKKEEPQAEVATPTERKKSTESEEDGKQKKGVINKILELVGVGKPETSTAVFYDTEQPQSEQPKEDRGNSVFYDAPSAESAGGEEPKLSTVADPSKVRAPSPSLTLKTSPETEVVCPTPPSTPMTPLPGFKDDKMLTVDDTIKATPPVTDKKFDDVPKPADKDTIKSEVDNIIDAAKKIAEEQLQEPKKEPQGPPLSTSMALVPRLNDALEVFGKLFVSGPVTIKSEVTEEPKPAIPMPDVPAHTAQPAAPVTPQPTVSPTTETTPADAPQPAESEKQAEPVVPSTEPAAADAPKPEEPSAPKISELAAAAVEAVAAVLSKVADPIAPAPSQTTAPDVQPVTPKPTEPTAQPVATILGTPGAPQVSETPALVVQPATPLTLEMPSLGIESVTPQPAETSPSVAQPEAAKPTESTTPAATEQAPAPASAPQPEVPPTLQEAPKPDETKPAAEEPKPQSPSILSKANEALEAFGKHFVSGPVTLKSEVTEPVKPDSESAAPAKEPEVAVPEKPASESVAPAKEPEVAVPEKPASESAAPAKEPEVAVPEKPASEPVALTKDPEPSAGHSKESEALEAFGKVFVSGPVTLKSEVCEEAKTPGEAETDAVHRVFQPKPEGEPIYSNVDDIEEIKVTSEEDRRKEKPQSSKLTDQILKAIPPEMRKPFSDIATDVSAEVAQLLSAVEEQTTSILLDKPTEEDAPVAEQGDGSGPSAPPVPPRRNRSKGRDAPLPPPKKKGKNGKD